MEKRSSRLRFVEEAADKTAAAKPQNKTQSGKKAGRHKTVGQASTPSSKLKTDADKAAEKQFKLRFGKAEITVDEMSRMSKAQKREMYARVLVSGTSQGAGGEEDTDDNVGVQSAEAVKEASDVGNDLSNRSMYSRKLRSRKRAQKLQASETFTFAENASAETPNIKSSRSIRSNLTPDLSNPFSRWKQQQNIRKGYAAAARSGTAGTAKTGQNAAKSGSAVAEGVGGIVTKAKAAGGQAMAFASQHPHFAVAGLALAALLLIVLCFFSSCSVFFQGGANILVTTSYTAEDEDIIGANNDYKDLEAELQRKVDTIRTAYPGYDEYDLDLDEINHDPYVLASYLAVLYEDYTREEVQAALRQIFEQQYELTIRPEVQIRTRVVPYVYIDPFTLLPMVGYRTEQYEYRILHVTLKNNTLEAVVESAGLTEEQKERYDVLLETKGNKPYLFGDDIYANPTGPAGTYEDYDVPAEALTDDKFARMLAEAEKYLGMKYVWGGSSPSTGFDCSGYVSWVINNCGNGWSVGRQTANGLKKLCTTVSASEAKPGDLVFFQGTYDTPGASHCGIYVGNGMMIHCGNPISYTSINKSYWQEHFLCFGRLP